MKNLLRGLLVVAVFTVPSLHASGPTAWVGYLSDDGCGATKQPNHAACARKCVRGRGEKYALVLDSKKVVLLKPGKIGSIDDLYSAIERGIDAGSDRFEATGTIADDGSLVVDKIRGLPIKEKPKP